MTHKIVMIFLHIKDIFFYFSLKPYGLWSVRLNRPWTLYTRNSALRFYFLRALCIGYAVVLSVGNSIGTCTLKKTRKNTSKKTHAHVLVP